MKFELKSNFKPAGGQVDAINKLVNGYNKYPKQTLLGITGSGKTFVIANLIEKIQKKTLVLAHNKTLAAQLYQELKEFFPNNRVEYFISYYDYYQPESYIPTSDTYIEKEATVNKEIEKMRLKAISSVLSRDDTIIVASTSCIYGAGNPEDFKSLAFEVKKNDEISRTKIISNLINMLYERNDAVLEEGRFRVRGDTIDIFPPYYDKIIRIEMFGDEIENIFELDKITNNKLQSLDSIRLFPAKQFVVPQEKQELAIKQIQEELSQRVKELPLLEEQRLKQRVKYDIEMMQEVGYCTGIENYSRFFDDRKPGDPPFVLLDYFGDDFMMVIDESHQTIPQANAMYKGDYSRKKNLVDFGFRLPSAFDNRPLKFEEFEKYLKHTVFVSATPGDYEVEKSGQIVEQIIRPTGLLDPIIEVKSSDGQVQDLIKEIKKVVNKNERVLVTTLTKRMAEDLTDYFSQKQIKVRYMHSDIESLDRIELIRQLRIGEFDVLIGINLLREGLDIPEVSLVAILDADKEGFLRNERSLIQTIGRAARNSNGRVIMYRDVMTKSIKQAIEVTNYRREEQIKYNKKHGITPTTIIKKVENKVIDKKIRGFKHLSKTDIKKKIIELETQMKKSAQSLDFEKAIEIRDVLEDMKKLKE
ncbi:MAG: excinuclease ABC subunit UvrB [Nanoarchaeota archaeon]